MGIALASFIILFREGLEILLILMTITRVLKPGTNLVPVYAGAVAGVVLNLVLGLVFDLVALHNEFADRAILLLAAALMLYVARGLILLQLTGKEKEERLRQRFYGVGSQALFYLTFAVVAREAFELLLFLEALNIQAGGWTLDMVVGLGAAAAVLVGFGVMLQRAMVILPVRVIFLVSSVYLIGQAGYFIWEALA